MKHHNKKNQTITAIAVSFLLATFLLFLPAWGRGYDKGRGYDYGYMDGEYNDYNLLNGYRGDRKHSKRRDRRSLAFFGLDIDENQDDEVTREEAESFSQKIFSDIDADNNESLTSEELVSYHQDRAEKLAKIHYGRVTDEHMKKIKEHSERAFSRLDKDNNEQISSEEFYQSHIGRGFERLDKNKDGVITEDEMSKRKGKR